MTSEKTPFQIPAEMKAYADRTFDQAHKAFGVFVARAEEAVTKADGSAKVIGEKNAEANRRLLAFTEENVNAALELARALVRADTVEEMMRVQSEFATQRVQAMTASAKEIGAEMGRMAENAVNATKPK